MKKKSGVLGVAVLLAALMAFAGVAQSAMWVGGEIGGNFLPSTSVDIDVLGVRGVANNQQFDSSVIGGGAIGYDFVNTGFGAYAWPDWMKYFSVFTDFTYNRRDMRDVGIPSALPPFVIPAQQRVEGYDAVWSFMLMAHYPFLPDAEVPGGRLKPYIAVGPGIQFSSMEIGKGWGSASAVNIALVVESGIRFMCLKNVSIDGAFRYRYSQPSYDFSVAGVDVTAKADPLHQLSFLFRANYHF